MDKYMKYKGHICEVLTYGYKGLETTVITRLDGKPIETKHGVTSRLAVFKEELSPLSAKQLESLEILYA